MFDVQKFNSFDFKKSIVEKAWGVDPENTSQGFLTLYCKFFDAAEYPYFDLGFETFDKDLVLPEGLIGAEITGITITKDEKYSVKLEFLINGKSENCDFTCKKVSFRTLKYRGISYRNVYDIWLDELNKRGFVESPEYFDSEEVREFDGLTLKTKLYVHPESNNKDEDREFLKVFELTAKNFTYLFRAPTHNKDFDPTKTVIEHSNGRRYLPFGVSMYGISYIDIDSGNVYNYIPEGYEYDADDPVKIGESFIIRKINYDPKTDLIAYTGCYWAGPDDVMVGDFSDPLNFDPRLVSVSEILSPDEMPDFDDLFFARFENGELVVSCDGLSERRISCEVLKNKIKSIGAGS